MRFRLKVHKLKCIDCDLIFLVEIHKNFENDLYCPSCESHAEHMGDIMIAQEKSQKSKFHNISQQDIRESMEARDKAWEED